MDINISALLEFSHEITTEEKTLLAQLKQEYPWSELVQVAYLKSLKDSNDLRFPEELKRVALITQNRTQLYKIIYGADLQKTIKKVEAEMAALPETEGLISPDWDRSISEKQEPTDFNSMESKTANETEIPKIITEFKDPTPESKSEEENEVLKEESPLSEIEEKVVEVEVAEEIKTATEEVQNEEVEQLENVSPTIKISEKKDEKPILNLESEELNHLIISEAVDTAITLDVIEDIAEKKLSQPKEVKTTPSETKEEISSDDFINWLVSTAASVKYPSFENNTNITPSKSADSIIEQFIQNEPQISRGKSKEFTTENLAADSLVDNEEFVTETLAEIYANQGNNSKAKRAFQLLSLKYPEKSIYFAARIKQLGRKK